MPNSPDVSFNALVRYERPMMNGMMAAQFDGQYVDKRTLNGIDHPSLNNLWLYLLCCVIATTTKLI